jgi:hypothetical protein
LKNGKYVFISKIMLTTLSHSPTASKLLHRNSLQQEWKGSFVPHESESYSTGTHEDNTDKVVSFPNFQELLAEKLMKIILTKLSHSPIVTNL